MKLILDDIMSEAIAVSAYIVRKLQSESTLVISFSLTLPVTSFIQSHTQGMCHVKIAQGLYFFYNLYKCVKLILSILWE